MGIARRSARSTFAKSSVRARKPFQRTNCWQGFLIRCQAQKRRGYERLDFMTPVKIWLGYPYPLGATWLGNGVNFAIFSEMATSVDLCLFDNIDAPQENIRIPMTEQTDQVWHVFLPDVRPGQLYGYRVRSE